MTIHRRRIIQTLLVCFFGSIASMGTSRSEQQTNIDLILAQTRELFANDLCVVSEINHVGNTDRTMPFPDEATIQVRYDCKIVEPGPAQQSAARQKKRIRETGSARYDFACSRKEFKYFASGVDWYIDGSHMHWDSQGSSRPLPWASIASASGNQRLLSLFKIWCE